MLMGYSLQVGRVGLKVPLEQQMVNPHQPAEIWTCSSFPTGHSSDPALQTAHDLSFSLHTHPAVKPTFLPYPGEQPAAEEVS